MIKLSVKKRLTLSTLKIQTRGENVGFCEIANHFMKHRNKSVILFCRDFLFFFFLLGINTYINFIPESKTYNSTNKISKSEINIDISTNKQTNNFHLRKNTKNNSSNKKQIVQKNLTKNQKPEKLFWEK